MSEYERLVGIQKNEHPDNTKAYDTEVRVIENFDAEDTVHAGKKKP